MVIYLENGLKANHAEIFCNTLSHYPDQLGHTTRVTEKSTERILNQHGIISVEFVH